MKKLLEWLKKLLGQSSSQSGFTLVELLVIIGVLGILAVGLLATIDPIEQFKKGSDSNAKSASIEFVNAVQRYYSDHTAFPWDTTGGVTVGGTACAAPTNGTTKLTTANMLNVCVQGLVNEGELKSTFTSNTSLLDSLYIDYTSTTNTTQVCYDPTSKSESGRAETKYDKDGTAKANCPKDTNGNITASCYWCAQ